MIIMAIYFVRFGANLGALIAGKLGWESLVFWLLDNFVLCSRVSYNSERSR